MAGNSTESGRSVTSKIASILMAFTEGSEHSLSEIARLTGLPLSTAHRLTSELTTRRFLERTEDGLYRAGLPLRMIGAAESCAPSLQERAPCVLDDLATATRRRARLGVLRGLQVAYIEKVPGPSPVTTFSPAATLPAHPTALGRALLAFGPASSVEMAITGGLRSYTPYTMTSPDRFRRELAIIRLTRVAVTRRELETTTFGVAVPIFGAGGEVVAAIELATADLHHELRLMMATLSIASRSLSRELASEAPPNTLSRIPHPRTARPTAEQATTLIAEAAG